MKYVYEGGQLRKNRVKITFFGLRRPNPAPRLCPSARRTTIVHSSDIANGTFPMQVMLKAPLPLESLEYWYSARKLLLQR